MAVGGLPTGRCGDDPIAQVNCWRHPVTFPDVRENSSEPSPKPSVDQVGMLARCCTSVTGRFGVEAGHL